jgi:catalase
VHSQKKDPVTNLPSPSAAFEFWGNSPQSLHQVTILMSDRGSPYSYRHMHGFSSHTLSLWNAQGQRFWVKWHFKTNQGIKCLTNEEAAAQPPYGVQKDLIDAIERGEHPSWKVKLQIMSTEEAKSYRINPFDLTKVWPYADFPLIERVGANFNQLPVNAPRCPAHHYQRDGAMAGMPATFGADNNQGSGVNYYPSERINAGAPAPRPEIAEPSMPILGEAWVKAYDTQDEDNFGQAGALYRVMSEQNKDELAMNIAQAPIHAMPVSQQKMLAQFHAADPNYAIRVRKAMAVVDPNTKQDLTVVIGG